MVQPGAKVEKLADGMKFTEGPVWLPKEQKADFFGYPQQCTYAVEPEGWLVGVSEE